MSDFYDIDIKEYPLLEEKIYFAKHKSGLKLRFIPKKGFQKKFASCTFDFGAANQKFRTADGTVHESPLGTAHFLEHKMFDRPDKNILEQFSRNCADSNAGTSYSYTTYYFSCTDNFEKNFRLLLDLVKNPIFTEDSVEKEKGIIAQEINMYNDDPSYVASVKATEEMYKVNPVRYDIAGTEESIDRITAEELRLIHGLFYAPSNMVITVCGDINPEVIYEITDEYFAGLSPIIVPETIIDKEEEIVIGEKKTVVNHGDVSLPLFFVGYKDNTVNYDFNKLHIAGDIIKEAAFGKGTDFYEKMYEEGLINQEFYRYYDIDKAFKYMAFGGESKRPEKVCERIEEEIARIKKEGLPEKQTLDIIHSDAGAMLREFNSPVALGRVASSLALKNSDPFEYFRLYDEITPEYIAEVFGTMFRGHPVLSIIEEDKKE